MTATTASTVGTVGGNGHMPVVAAATGICHHGPRRQPATQTTI